MKTNNLNKGIKMKTNNLNKGIKMKTNNLTKALASILAFMSISVHAGDVIVPPGTELPLAVESDVSVGKNLPVNLKLSSPLVGFEGLFKSCSITAISVGDLATERVTSTSGVLGCFDSYGVPYMLGRVEGILADQDQKMGIKGKAKLEAKHGHPALPSVLLTKGSIGKFVVINSAFDDEFDNCKTDSRSCLNSKVEVNAVSLDSEGGVIYMRALGAISPSLKDETDTQNKKYKEKCGVPLTIGQVKLNTIENKPFSSLSERCSSVRGK
jgi:hypothetical protein